MSITTPIFILITVILAQTSEVLRCGFNRTRGGESPLACLKFSWPVIILAATGSLISLISHYVSPGTTASLVVGASLMVIIDALIIKIMFDFATKIFSWECPDSGLRRLWCWSSKVVTWLLIIAVITVLLYKIDSVQASIENSLLVHDPVSDDESLFSMELSPHETQIRDDSLVLTHLRYHAHDYSMGVARGCQQWFTNVLLINQSSNSHQRSDALALTKAYRNARDYLPSDVRQSHNQSVSDPTMNRSDGSPSRHFQHGDVGWYSALRSRVLPDFRSGTAITTLTLVLGFYAYY